MRGEGGSAGFNRLYRIPSRGMIFGVCAGLADYFGFDINVTRVLVVIGTVFSAPLMILAYVVLGFLLPVRAYGERDMPDPVQAQVRSNPHSSLSSVRYRFRDLDSRLQRLEKYVTSSRYKLDREFEQLK